MKEVYARYYMETISCFDLPLRLVVLKANKDSFKFINKIPVNHFLLCKSDYNK